MNDHLRRALRQLADSADIYLTAVHPMVEEMNKDADRRGEPDVAKTFRDVERELRDALKGAKAALRKGRPVALSHGREREEG